MWCAFTWTKAWPVDDPSRSWATPSFQTVLRRSARGRPEKTTWGRHRRLGRTVFLGRCLVVFRSIPRRVHGGRIRRAIRVKKKTTRLTNRVRRTRQRTGRDWSHKTHRVSPVSATRAARPSGCRTAVWPRPETNIGFSWNNKTGYCPVRRRNTISCTANRFYFWTSITIRNRSGIPPETSTFWSTQKRIPHRAWKTKTFFRYFQPPVFFSFITFVGQVSLLFKPQSHAMSKKNKHYDTELEHDGQNHLTVLGRISNTHTQSLYNPTVY